MREGIGEYPNSDSKTKRNVGEFKVQGDSDDFEADKLDMSKSESPETPEPPARHNVKIDMEVMTEEGAKKDAEELEKVRENLKNLN